MAVSEENRLRYRAIQVSRQVKALFMAVPDRALRRIAGRFLLGWIMRWLFLGPDGEPHRAGEIVLAELRREGGLDREQTFAHDPHLQAYRAGRRDMAYFVFALLNLDEGDVQKMMELDDGLE